MILLTGATGYIGSHTWVELLNAGHEVIGIDNLSNSTDKVLKRIESISKIKPNFIKSDVRDLDILRKIFQSYSIDAVVHFAAFKAVGESVDQPLRYYDNNINGLLKLVQAMLENDCKYLVFSSSATVYGIPDQVPIHETATLAATNPYGQTKLIGEQILRDLERSKPEFNVAYLRYFNPVGAHPTGLIGENPTGIPNNLMPYVTQVAVGKRNYLSIFGDDWPTHDGTGVRDYIHVVDLAVGHIKAINYLMKEKKSLTVNLGTGIGYSVLDLVKNFELTSGKKVPYQIVGRRFGDIASCYADPSLAFKLMDWKAKFDLPKMCEDSWRWQSMNPNGYE